MRLLVLGVLRRYGPNHGHALRQFIRNAYLDQWADVQAGSLYYALDQLAKEGLIVEERTEQVGQRPPRTIFRITDGGAAEIEQLLVSLMGTVRPSNDPFNLALLFSGSLPDDRLADLIRGRITEIISQIETGRLGCEQSLAQGFISQRGAEIFLHLDTHLVADLAWHEQFLVKLLAGEAQSIPVAVQSARNPLFVSENPLFAGTGRESELPACE